VQQDITVHVERVQTYGYLEVYTS